MKTFAGCAIIAVLGVSGAALGSTVVLDDHFNDGSLANGSNATETDTAWYCYNNSTGGTAYNASSDSGGLLSGTVMRNPSGSATNTIAIGSFNAVTLAASGDSVTLSFDFRITTADASKRMIFGLYNDGGTAVSANEFGPTTSTSADDVGYGVLKYLNDNSAATLYQRSAASGNKSLNDANTTLTTTMASTATLGNSSVHHVDMTITRSDAGLIISTNFDSTGASSYTVTNPLTYTFNEVGLSANPGSNGFLIDNIVVTSDSAAVPEPASLTMISVAAGAILLGVARRKTV